MTQPIPVPVGDPRRRAVRTLGQNLVIDVALAVLVVVLPLLQAEVIAWDLVLASVCKTALVTAVAYTHRTLDAYRAAPR